MVDETSREDCTPLSAGLTASTGKVRFWDEAAEACVVEDAPRRDLGALTVPAITPLKENSVTPRVEREAAEGELTMDVVTVRGAGSREPEPDFTRIFDDSGRDLRLYETTPEGDLRIPVGERFSVEVPRRSAFRELGQLNGISTYCTEEDVGSGIRETIGGYMALAEQALRPSSQCSAAIGEYNNAEEWRYLGVIGADVFGNGNIINRGPDGRGFDVQTPDDVMDAKVCTQRFGADMCVGASPEGGGISIGRTW